MEKVRNINQFQDLLDQDIGWRIKEIADLKAAANSRRVFVRAGVAIAYAHWEGFVKNSSLAYLNLIECQNHSYRQLKTCFMVFGLKAYLNTLVQSKKARMNEEALNFLLNKLDVTARLPLDNAVNTESNLSSGVFENIALSLSIDTSRYRTRYNLIDESLLKRRNQIAHGEYVELTPAAFRGLADDTVLLMRDYKTDLENAASMKAYKNLT